MATSLNDNLPEDLKRVRTQPLFVMRLDVRKLLIVGATPGAYRRIGVVPGGSFEGERLSGEVLDGGSDWQTVRNDGATTLNVRLVLKTMDDALIYMTYHGVRHGPPDVVERIEKGEVVDPTSYYFRINPLLNRAHDDVRKDVAHGVVYEIAYVLTLGTLLLISLKLPRWNLWPQWLLCARGIVSPNPHPSTVFSALISPVTSPWAHAKL